MKIEFYIIETGEVLTNTDDWFFVMNNTVYQDNGESYESQCNVVTFEDFIKSRPDIGWRVAESS